jgi:tetratricopeptide (TPR) repeat protein
MVTPDPADVQRAVGARYEVLELVDAGGQGAVFCARHLELGHLVAIKVLPPEIAASKVREERFRREAQLAAHLSHPNVVPVYEFETRAGLTYQIMPFVRGGRTLKTLLGQRTRLPLADLLGILRDVGAALDFIHPRGVVHRDVKPGNILIEEETERALLADFGVALAGVSGGSLTGPAGIVGTDGYMPPEQLTGGARVDGRADLYALAVVAYQALVGELPVAGLDRAALADTLRQSRDDVSPALAAALVAPLADRPDERPPTSAAWLHSIGRSTGRSWRRPAIALTAIAVLAIGTWIALGRIAKRSGGGPERSLAVMPFAMLGTSGQLPPAQLPPWFLQRLGPVQQLRAISPTTVASFAGVQALVISEAESAAVLLGATYFVQPSLELTGGRARMEAQLFETKRGKWLATGRQEGSEDSVSQIMDAVWAQLLPPILRGNFAPVSSVTLPRGLAALRAYADAEAAFRSGDFASALEDYDQVLRADSTFAIGYFRRAIVVAQVDPREESLREALAGVSRHQSGLTPADSLLLEGYQILVERGDGRGALQLMKQAADTAPDQPEVLFLLGFFYFHFGELFGEHVTDAETLFDSVLSLTPNFAPAIAALIPLKHLRGDEEATAHLIARYEEFGTPSVVAEAVGIADTMLFHSLAARAALLKTLGNHSFTALEYLAFQAEEFGTEAERRGPGRIILLAVERRARTDSQQILALRLAVGADLRMGLPDSARARFARVRTPATERERDMWLVLLAAVGDSLGPWRDAARRLDRDLASVRSGGEIVHWMLARLGQDRARHVAALDRLAVDSSPLPLSLKLDLEARRALENGDSTLALQLWQQAIERYAVIRVPFDLAASLWWLRLDLAQLALAHRDTVLAARVCDSFVSPNGYVDLVIWPKKDRFCEPLRSVAGP